MTIVVDEDKCVGCGTCAMECPDQFELNDEGVTVFKNKRNGCNLVVVVGMCPAEAMEIKDG